MKVLVVSPYPPTPPLGGGRRRILELVRALSTRHEVDLACTVFEEEEARALSVLDSGATHFGMLIPDAAVRRKNTGVPLLDLMWNGALRETVLSLAKSERYDWVVAEHSYAIQFLSDVQAPIALSVHNVEYRLLEQLIALGADGQEARRLSGGAGSLLSAGPSELERLKSFERETWRTVDVCAVVSTAEAAIVSEFAGSENTIVVPNCPGESLRKDICSRDVIPDLCFFGSLDYVPNVDALLLLLRHILPRVRERFPTLRLTVAGRNPHYEIVELCRQAEVDLRANPDAIERVVSQGAILVCPLRMGAGTRIKILDAMAMKMPVVASSLAVEGLDLPEGAALIEDSVEGFSSSIMRLLSSRTVRKRLVDAGERLLQERDLRWPVVFSRYVDWLERRHGSVR